MQEDDEGMSLMEAKNIQNQLVDYNKKIFSDDMYSQEYKANLVALKEMGFLNFEKNHLALSQTGNQLEYSVLKLLQYWINLSVGE